MRRLKIAAATAGLLVLAAQGPSPATSSAPVGASPEPPSPVASPTVAPPTVAQVTAWVNAAKLPATAIGTAKPVNDISGIAPTLAVCNVGIAADQHELFAHYWRWTGKRIPYVEHAVFGYPGAASDVVTQIRNRASSCPSYDQKDPSGTGRVAFAGKYAFTPLTGIDGAYAFCEKSTTVSPAQDKGQVGYICTAAVSRRDVLVTVRVFGAKATLASARAALGPPLRLAESTLVKAVPAP
jgi:hypothetical protein